MKKTETCLKLLEASCATSTWKQYEVYIKRFEHYRGIQQISIDLVLNFLSGLYDSGLGYVSINTARSALSSRFGELDGHPIGSHPLVIRLCKGVGRLRPPKCKYDETWDASLVLELLKNWNDNGSLSLLELSMKCIALLALCSGQRMQTLRSISRDDIEFTSVGVTIRISTRLKTLFWAV